MSSFDEYDALASQAVGALVNERVIWRPMRARPVNIYTNAESEPDPDRPVRGLGSDVLEAAVTWRPSMVDIGTTDEQGGVVVADCVVDFDNAVFRDAGGRWSIPRKGDRFELAEEYVGNNLVEIQRDGDDGSARLHFWCAIIS
jgi:hypothetical protein